MIKFALDGLLSFSTKPLQVSVTLGLFAAVLAMLGILCACRIEDFQLGLGRRLDGLDDRRAVHGRGAARVARHHRRIYRPHLQRGGSAGRCTSWARRSASTARPARKAKSKALATSDQE